MTFSEAEESRNISSSMGLGGVGGLWAQGGLPVAGHPGPSMGGLPTYPSINRGRNWWSPVTTQPKVRSRHERAEL